MGGAAYARKQSHTSAYVNIYEFDADKLGRVQAALYSPSQPRNGQSLSWQTEPKKSLPTTTTIVYGPVANDRVYFQFGLYESGAISVDTLIRELKTYKLVDQYLFHTEKALTALHFVESRKIEL